ncbi:MAG: GyrI-like domain-containing protein [Thermodesulfobacteriota bacterium]|nr:GyrI-like domain-containing protein [Thermodesulfobacteriota bacterium]
MSEVSIKFLMGIKVASIEKEGPVGEVGKAIERLYQFLKGKNVKVTGAAMGLFHDDPKSFNPQKAKYEVCLPISGKFKEEGGVKSKELGKGAFACITHTGPIGKLADTYNTILKWIEDNGYRIAGSAREIYPERIGEVEGNLPEFLIEVQFPVRK